MSLNNIPLLDLSPEIDALWDQLSDAIQAVLRSGQFIMGPDVHEFEAEAASFLDVGHTIGLNSGTDALVIALRALDIGPGDEVITTPFTFFATAEAISLVGATPVFVDIDPETFNLQPKLIATAINARTKAILPVHLFGHAAEMDAIQDLSKQHGLKIVEDTAQAFGGAYKGKQLGTIGHLGAFSFFPSKTLGAYGDGGMLVTSDDELAHTCRMLRTHGSLQKYHNEVLGYNSRLDTLQAAILRIKLQYVNENNQARQNAAQRYHQLLNNIPGIYSPGKQADVTHVYHQYTIRVGDGKRDALQSYLKQHGIASQVYYPVPLHQLPIYRELGYHLPEAERAAREVLSLPIWPQITQEIQSQVSNTIADFIRSST